MKNCIQTSVIEVRETLQKIADELGLPIEHPDVGTTWSARGFVCNDKIWDEVIRPLYFPPEQAIYLSMTHQM